jgi:hypothetical protein
MRRSEGSTRDLRAAHTKRATQGPTNWWAIIGAARPAIYGFGETTWWSHLLSDTPLWYGTGFEAKTTLGSVVDYTAAHIVVNFPSHRLIEYPMMEAAWNGSRRYVVTEEFKPGYVQYWPHSDVVMYDAYEWASWVPDNGHPLPLGSIATVAKGTPLLILGNADGEWSQTGMAGAYHGTYVGPQGPFTESGSSRADPSTIVADFAIQTPYRDGIAGGASGSPVITPAGQVVGVVIAASPYMVYASPLNPETGYPVAAPHDWTWIAKG